MENSLFFAFFSPQPHVVKNSPLRSRGLSKKTASQNSDKKYLEPYSSCCKKNLAFTVHVCVCVCEPTLTMTVHISPALSHRCITHRSFSYFLFERHNTSWVSISHLFFCPHSSFSLPPPPIFSFPLSFVALRCSIEQHIKPNLEPLFPLSSASWPLVALRRLKAFKRVASRGWGDMVGGGRVEGTHNCLLREAFSPAFVPLAHCTLTFLTAAAPVGSRHQTPCSLRFSAFSDGGPNNNTTQPSIVFHWKPPRLHKQSTLFFLSGSISHHYSGLHCIATHPPISRTLSKRFCGTKTTSWDKRGRQQGF